MKWFKHDTAAAVNNKLRRLVLRHGPVGYAVYFHCLELIAGAIDAHNITFELRHDSEVIADNLKVQGDGARSGREVVEAAMLTIIELGLFEESDGRVFCMKLAERLDNSTVKNPELARVQASIKAKAHRSLPDPGKSRKIPDNPGQIRSDEIRSDETNTNTAPAEPAREKVVAPKPKRELHPLTKPVLDAWAGIWREKYGTPYPWNAGTKARDGQAGYFAVSAIASSFCSELERQGVALEQVERGMRWWLFDSYEGYQRTVPAFVRGCFTTHGCREAMGAASNTAAEESFEEFAARMNRRGKA